MRASAGSGIHSEESKGGILPGRPPGRQSRFGFRPDLNSLDRVTPKPPVFTNHTVARFHRNMFGEWWMQPNGESKAATTSSAVAAFDWHPVNLAQRKQSIRPPEDDLIMVWATICHGRRAARTHIEWLVVATQARRP
jgi:hypothetical protein